MASSAWRHRIGSSLMKPVTFLTHGQLLPVTLECSHFHRSILEAGMFVRFAQFAMAALGLVTGSHAHGAALVYGTYYDESKNTGCSGSECRINYSQTPSDKLLLVRKLGCIVVSGAPLTNVELFVSATEGGSALSRSFPMSFPAPRLVGTTNYFTNINEDLHFLVGQGRFPFVSVQTNTASNYFVSCTLIGDLVSPI
jgi:hypothetical protein